MPSRDQSHFDQYTAQTRAKHAILSGYLPAYLKALKGIVGKFSYIDGFAGKGRYSDDVPGSPLIAIDTITQAGLADRTALSFVEKRKDFYDELVACVATLPGLDVMLARPLIRHGRLDEHLDEILSHEIYQFIGDTATFAFIDPCGVDGVRMSDLVRLLGLPFGELLLFFNYSGVNRLVGGLIAGTADRRVLVELCGSNSRVDTLEEAIRVAQDPKTKEDVTKYLFLSWLKEDSGASYYVPFRIESGNADRTSHYIVHASRSKLAFKIMKSVMSKTGRGDSGQYGRLELETGAEFGRQMHILRFDIEERKREIIERIQSGLCTVGEFTVKWMEHPSDPYSERDYRIMLLELERDGLIAVYDKQNQAAAPAASRQHRFGEPTLAPGLWLRIPG